MYPTKFSCCTTLLGTDGRRMTIPFVHDAVGKVRHRGAPSRAEGAGNDHHTAFAGRRRRRVQCTRKSVRCGPFLEHSVADLARDRR